MRKLFILSLLFCLALLVAGGNFKGKKATAADYNVSGEPSISGNYFYNSEHNGKSAYHRWDRWWYIWWDIEDDDKWIISASIGAYGGYAWQHVDPSILGVYEGIGHALDDGTVSAGPQ